MEMVGNEAKSNAGSDSRAWLIVAAAGLRTAFGVLMSIDAYLKWQPGFAAHYVGYLQNAANAQPHWLQPWFHIWLRLVTMHTPFFIFATRWPQNAAAAVSPLSIASGKPVARVASPVLPPLIADGDTVAVTIESKDTTVEIASGVQYQAWTFGGTVPGPILHVRQGQTVNVTFVNSGTMRTRLISTRRRSRRTSLTVPSIPERSWTSLSSLRLPAHSSTIAARRPCSSTWRMECTAPSSSIQWNRCHRPTSATSWCKANGTPPRRRHAHGRGLRQDDDGPARRGRF
jgi:hypothetical protein